MTGQAEAGRLAALQRLAQMIRERDLAALAPARAAEAEAQARVRAIDAMMVAVIRQQGTMADPPEMAVAERFLRRAAGQKADANAALARARAVSLRLTEVARRSAGRADALHELAARARTDAQVRLRRRHDPDAGAGGPG